MTLITVLGASFTMAFFSMCFMNLYLAANNLTSTDIIRKGFLNK